MNRSASEILHLSGDRYGQKVVLLYFLSGMVGLAYQVLWMRMLSLQFGVSIFGVVVTAAAFMIGLGGGALLGGPLLRGIRNRRVANPLRLFALLEGGVALYALALPLLLELIDSGVQWAAPARLWQWYSLQGLCSLLLIVLPALALGMGFPMVLRAIDRTKVSLGQLYGMNTLGASLGALLPLWLLPLWGWSVSVWVVAVTGGALALAALGLAKSDEQLSESKRDRPSSGAVSIPLSTLWAYAGVGAAALMLEVGWTRLFGMLLLRTEYVVAVILAVFLLGIGAGAIVARWLAGRFWFELLPALGAGFALLSLWGIGPLAAWMAGAEFGSLAAAMWGQGLAIALLTLPVTLIFGAWLPLLNHRLGGEKSAAARLYGVNAAGGALGALVAGFALIPWLGTMATVVTAALLLFISGCVWSKTPKVWLALPLLLMLAWPVSQLPPVSLLLPNGQADSRDLMVHEDGLAITHVVERSDGQRLLLADLQRMDASSDPVAVISQQNQTRLPLLLHPAPKSVLFLGLGTGISAAASLPFPNLERTAVELSQGAIDAAGEWFGPVNDSVSGQMRIVRDDARRFLRRGGETYDVIIGDLFHPDLVGRSALLSLQQFERARQRLNPGGVFVQWLALNQFDVHSLQVVLRTFQQAFGDAAIFIDGFRLAMVGVREGHVEAQALLANLARLDSGLAAEVTGGEGPWTWLGRYWGRLNLGAGPVQGEWSPVIEYQLPRARFQGDMDLPRLLEWLLARRPALDSAMAELGLAAAQKTQFEPAYAATELGLRGWLAELQGRYPESQRLLRFAYQANPLDRWISGAIADRMYASLDQVVARGMAPDQALSSILKLRPDHAGALADMWRLFEERGDEVAAAEYWQRYARISPFSSQLSHSRQGFAAGEKAPATW